ncbi:MAG: STAS domain-containing protein [Dactylosporangium sp.]|nr:MEDS domain-containing protein [Dactylosporangium sp.]NNJ62864.1 STAS domain-containing protein [Dactylosporangium sp.]
MNVNPVLDHLDIGDHVCCPVGSVEECWAVAAAGTSCGLHAGHKVLFFADDPDGLSGHLAARVPGARRALTNRQLQVQAGAASYAPQDTFDGDQMIDRIASEAVLAQRQGFSALRVSGGLSAVLDGTGDADADAVVDYETRVNTLLSQEPIIAVCHYDLRTTTSEVWQRLVAAHPTTVVPTGKQAVSRLRGLRTRAGIRLAGEADLANHAALAHLLADVTAAPGTCLIDATELRFADARALGCLLRTAESRGGRATVIACPAHVAECLRVLGADRIPQLTVRAAA